MSRTPMPITPSDLAGAAPLLSSRQLEVVAAAANGLSRWEAARQLGLPIRLVDQALLEARRAMGASNTTQTVAVCLLLTMAGKETPCR